MKTRYWYLIVWIILVSLCLSVNVMAQQYSANNKSTKNTEMYYTWAYKDSANGTYVPVKNYADGGGAVGEFNIGNPGNLFTGTFDYSGRTAYQWDFTNNKITNLTVTSVRLEFWYTGGSGYTIDVKKLLTYQYNLGASNRWAAIKSASNYSSFISTSGSGTQYKYIDFAASNSICSDIAGVINAGSQFSIALMMEGDETWNDVNTPAVGSISLSQVKLTVNYTIPISVTVQNGTPGNGDSVIVDGTKYASPSSFNWTSSY